MKMNLSKFVSVVLLLWSQICKLAISKELPHYAAYTLTTEVRFYHHRRYKWPAGLLEKFCGELGMEVLTAYTIETYHQIVRYMERQDKYAKIGFWYSLNDRKTDGSWYHADGTAMKYFTWWPNEPDGGNEQSCTALRKGEVSGWLIDVTCKTGEYYAACSRRLGKPNIEFIENQDCDTSLDIRWTADAASVGLKHRINVQATDASMGMLVDEKVFEPGSRTTTVRGLQSGKKYTIEVTVCTDYCCCGHMSSSTESDTFVGKPLPMKDLILKQEGDTCTLTWRWPDHVKPADITEYRLTLASSPADRRDVSEDAMDKQDMAVLDSKLNYEFRPRPNREYIVWGQSGTCAGFGEKLKAQGQCRTGSQAPKYVPNPTVLFLSTSQSLQVTLPNQPGLKIGCVFVVIQPLPPQERIETSTDTGITIDALKNASSAPPTTDRPYLAIAMPGSQFSGDSADFKLGTEKTTKCNITKTEQKSDWKPSALNFIFPFNIGATKPPVVTTVKNTTLKAQNWEIKQDWSYSFYVVISTSVNGDPVLIRSASSEMSVVALSEPAIEMPTESFEESTYLTVTATEEGGCSSLPLVAAGLIFVIDLLAGGGIVFFMKKSKAASNEEEVGEVEEDGEEENIYGETSERRRNQDEHSRKKKKKKHKDRDGDSSRERSRDDESRKSHLHHHKRHKKKKDHERV